MTNTIPFNWNKRAGERKIQPVRFLTEYGGPFDIDFFTVIVKDSEGYDVTDQLVDSDRNAFQDNVLQIMFIGGDEGEQYTVYVYVNDDDTTEEPIVKALLTVLC